MSSKLLKLNFTILEMIFESFRMEKKNYDALVRDSTSIFRIMKYKVPPRKDENLGLVAHTDKNALTVLCQNDVQGLEVMTKEGRWEHVVVPREAFVVIVGDALKVSTLINDSLIHDIFTLEHMASTLPDPLVNPFDFAIINVKTHLISWDLYIFLLKIDEDG